MGEEKETADLHDGGCLRELQRLLDGGVDGLVPALPQRQDRVVQHLRPATPPRSKKHQIKTQTRPTEQEAEDPCGTQEEQRSTQRG